MCIDENPAKLNDEENIHGLRGGSGENSLTNVNQEETDKLQLVNRRNDCFVNAVVQLISVTDYIHFLKNMLNPLIVDKSWDYNVCETLVQLYDNHTKGPKSADLVRKYVSQRSGRPHLNDGSQQDAEEFLSALEDTIYQELKYVEEFRVIRNKHWGKVEIRRLFRDNTENGRCKRCNQYLSSHEEKFLTLRLNIPRSEIGVNLSSIIQNHFSENSKTVKLRCSNCCPHEGAGVKCTQSGVCRDREATEIIKLIEAPDFLFIQLLRYDGLYDKVMTHVKLETELVLPNEVTYEPIAALNHIGGTINSGHYVTHLQNEFGQWMLFNDTFNRLSSINEANSVDNYILLFKRKNIMTDIPDKSDLPSKRAELRTTFVGDDSTSSIEDVLANINYTPKFVISNDDYCSSQPLPINKKTM